MTTTQQRTKAFMDMTLGQLVEHCHTAARSKGWHDESDPQNPLQVLAWIALVHSELSEAVECVRTGDMHIRFDGAGKPEGFIIEVADALIRICDMCGAMGAPLSTAVATKLVYNESRSYRHGNKRA